jgi:adenylate cyclase
VAQGFMGQVLFPFQRAREPSGARGRIDGLDIRMTNTGLITRRLRIVTGLILFAFVATHLLNHALGLVSLEAMDVARDWRTAVTRSLPVTVLLAAAALVHLVMGLARFLSRRSLRMPLRDALQLAFGLLVPILLFRHIIGTRVVHEAFGVDDDYTYALWVMWPAEAWRQGLLIVLVWVHASIGIHMWLSFKPWYRRVRSYFLGLAVLIPVLGFAGFAVGGREIRLFTDFQSPFSPEQYRQAVQWLDWAFWGYLAILGGFIAVRLARAAIARLRPRIQVTYGDGRTVVSEPGFTLLDISRHFAIPHASICGGRARCSTCRVRVLQGLDDLHPPGERERRVLDRVGAASNVRLACQIVPTRDLKVVTLLPAHRLTIDDLQRMDKYFWGVEQEVTLLFADIRGFTRLSEEQLPYDVVFLLNQYLARMSDAIVDAGGYIDKFMGDGIMAIFGMDRRPEEGAREAVRAARAMGGVLQGLNQSLHGELPEPLRIGIGIHTGLAILGRIGVSSGTGAGERVTALGDTVNTASRLESASKDLAVELVLSAHTAELAGIAIPRKMKRRIRLRGRAAAVEVYAAKRALDVELPEAAVTTAPPAAGRG